MTTNHERIAHLKRQQAYEMEWRRRIYIALRRQKGPFIRKAREEGLLIAWYQIDGLIVADPIVSVMERMYRAIVPTEAEAFYRANVDQKSGRMGFSHEWIDSLDEWLKSFLYDLIGNMTDYTKRIILNHINAGLAAGDGYDVIIKKIVDTGLDKVRAENIARTESNRAMGWAKWDAAGKLPYAVRLMWIASRDKRTRGTDSKDKADHFHLNGQRTPFGTPFVDPRSGAKMNFPGDVSMGAGAADVCNCRCTISARRLVET